MRGIVRQFAFSGLSSAVVIVLIAVSLGFSALVSLLILAIIEITFSFDNAILNARVLKRMSPLWQKLFLSIGIIIAIFGMRLLFPIVIVALTAGLPWHTVVDLALNHPHAYAKELEVAQPLITAFGGSFLLMLSLQFFVDLGEEEHWLRRVEHVLHHGGRWWLPAFVTAVVVAAVALAPANHHPADTIKAAIVGALTYVCINGLTTLMGRFDTSNGRSGVFVGWSAFVMFIYLELLDASFSLDGVLGAFAITSNVVLIVAGLGIGAVWVRSLTVFMVRRGILEAYKYLEHGAHYAIAVLALCLLVESLLEVPSALVGAAGLAIIAASIVSSVRDSSGKLGH